MTEEEYCAMIRQSEKEYRLRMQREEQEEYNKKSEKQAHTVEVVFCTLAVVGIIYSILTAVHP